MFVSIISCLCVLNYVSGSDRTIVWTLKTPVFLRGNASIFCMIPENDKPGHMSWIKDGKVIGLNEVSLNATKYAVFTQHNNSSTIYHLVIKHIVMDDLDLVYKCESGFSSAEGILPLNKDTFVALPKKEDISRNFTLTEGLFHCVIEVSFVYPLPECNSAFKDKDLTRYSKTNYSKKFKLYSMRFNLVYQADECGDMTTSCVIGKNKFMSLQIANNAKYCRQLNTTEISEYSRFSDSKVAGIIVGSVAVLVILCCLTYLRRTYKHRVRSHVGTRHDIEYEHGEELLLGTHHDIEYEHVEELLLENRESVHNEHGEVLPLGLSNTS